MTPGWTVHAEDKFGKPVMISFEVGGQGKTGVVFLLPHIHSKGLFLKDFLTSSLQDIVPHLYPVTENKKWTEYSDYELPSVIKLNAQIEQIRVAARDQIEDLQKKINSERKHLGYVHDLITEKDDILVKAVAQVLRDLGFNDIADMDEELANSNSNAPKREDLQIRDRSPLVLTEVKGVFGTVQDHEGLQVLKYIPTKMKALQRTDIRGLSIVNHQRGLPPLERQPKPFNEDVLNTVVEQDIGLLTTWNLYRLVRNFQRWNWRHEDIVDLFYQDGFIEPIPTHYKYVGKVENFYPKANAVSIEVEQEPIKLNDRIAFELPVEFEEQIVESLRIENVPAETVQAGQFAGITTTLTKDQLRPGVRVYVVRRDAQ